MRQTLLIFVFLVQMVLAPFSTLAQSNYPIFVSPSLLPPYSLQLSDYSAHGSQRLMVTIVVNDLEVANLPVKLRLKMETAGATIETPATLNTTPIYLDGGSATVLFGEDLYDYFNLNNLKFSGFSKEAYQRSGQMPEGFYRFSIEVLHFHTNRVISNTGTTSAWMALGHPPVLRMPANDAELGQYMGVPITFSWLSSNVGSPVSAGSIRYKFELWEVRVKGVNPYNIVGSMPVFYEHVTSTNSYSFNPASVMMEEGMTYAWRVTAFDESGLVPFAQNGQSEVRTFTYKSRCEAVSDITATAGGQKGSFVWTPEKNHTSFNVEVRNADTDWFSASETYDSKVEFFQLERGQTYELRVQAVCNGDAASVSDYSSWTSLLIPDKKPDESNDDCPDCACSDDLPDVELTNFELRHDLTVGDTLTNKTGTTRFIVREVNPQGNGIYSGIFYFWGELWGMKVPCEFSDLQVNTDNVIVNMDYKSINDPKFLVDVDVLVEKGNDFLDQLATVTAKTRIVDTISVQQEFDYVVVKDGELYAVVVEQDAVVERPMGVSLEEAKQKLIANADGDEVVISSKGEPMGVQEFKATGGNNRLVKSYNEQKEREQLTEGSMVGFLPYDKQNYGFDAYDPLKQRIQHFYPSLDNGYRPAFKSVESFRYDKVLTDASSDISFRDEMGIPALSATGALNVQGHIAGSNRALYAYRALSDSTEEVVGKLNVVSFDNTLKRVHVVPVNGAKMPTQSQLEHTLKQVYKQAIATWTVVSEPGVSVHFPGGRMTHEGSGTFSTYNDDQTAIVDAYVATGRKIERGDLYLFFVEGATFKDRSLAGYMPLNRQVGFIYDNPSPIIVAHELGHGAFNLRHTFSPEEFIQDESKTQNLMDYAGGTDLWKYQWDLIHDPQTMLFAFLQDEEEGAAFGTGTKALCIKDNDALQKLSKYNVFYLPDGRIVDLEGKYKVSGFFTQEDVTESARGAIFSLKINGYDNKHAYSGTKSVGFGYKKNDETLALFAKVDDMSILETSDNVVRVFIDKTNKSIQVKSKAGEILETISFNDECNCVYPVEGLETYFTSNNVSQSYIDYFNQRSQKIDNALHEDTEVINQLVEKVNADKDNNNKDELLLGTKLADKLKTFEIFNNRKFIVATLPINTLCTNQNTWNTIANEVFEKAGLPADAILITIPYVHCSGIGTDLGEYYFMPGIAFGSNAKIELSKLRTDYSNTQRVAEFATNQKFPVGEFIEDVFTNTYKKAVVYRGIYNGSNAIEAVKYEKDNVTGLPFNKTIELYRQQEYTKLVNVVKDWEAANQGLLDVYKKGALSAYDYANQLRFTDFEYRKEFAEVLAEVAQASGLEKFTPSSDNLFIYKEEFIESTYGSNEDINAIHYIKNRAFKELQVELNYPYSDDFEYAATITLNRDFWTDHVDPVVYTTLDVTSITLGIIVPGADIFPESIGLFYSAARLNVERTAIYTVAVAIPTSMGNPIVVNKTFKQLGSNVFKIVRRETIEVTENAADDLLLDFVEAEYKKGKFSETDYLSLKAKKGEELKTAIDDLLRGVGLANYANVRKYLTNSRTKQYLTNEQLLVFENKIKSAHPDVLKYLDEMDEYDFAEMARGYKDNPTAFANVIKNLDDFNGTHGWLKFWKLTPKMETSLNTITNLKNAGKVADVGAATDIQLASIHAYTANGDFINQPFRYQPTWFGEYNTKAIKHINEGLVELRKVDGRLFKGRVYSGKTFSKADFESKFVGKINTQHSYNGYMSTSKLETVAEGFIDLTKQWASGSDEYVAVIQRVISKNGVYIDDISDWGKNLGKLNHPTANVKIQVQEEVLLNSQKLKQVSEPIPVMENGVQKTIDGIEVYYVDFLEVL